MLYILEPRKKGCVNKSELKELCTLNVYLQSLTEAEGNDDEFSMTKRPLLTYYYCLIVG